MGEFVRWATGADEPRPWWTHVLAALILTVGTLVLLWRAWHE